MLASSIGLKGLENSDLGMGFRKFFWLGFVSKVRVLDNSWHPFSFIF